MVLPLQTVMRSLITHEVATHLVIRVKYRSVENSCIEMLQLISSFHSVIVLITVHACLMTGQISAVKKVHYPVTSTKQEVLMLLWFDYLSVLNHAENKRWKSKPVVLLTLHCWVFNTSCGLYAICLFLFIYIFSWLFHSASCLVALSSACSELLVPQMTQPWILHLTEHTHTHVLSLTLFM